MTGGSANKSAGILSRANELERLQQQKDGLSEDLKAAERALEEARRELTAANYEMETAVAQRREHENTVLKLEERVAAAREQVGELELRRENLQGELEQIRARAERTEADTEQAKARIDERLLVAYERIRRNMRNHLAVVTVKRDACGGCFNHIPPQRQAEIRQGKKIIVCEYCGRILVAE